MFSNTKFNYLYYLHILFMVCITKCFSVLLKSLLIISILSFKCDKYVDLSSFSTLVFLNVRFLIKLRQFIIVILIICVTNNHKHISGVVHMRLQFIQQIGWYWHHKHSRSWCIDFPFYLLLQTLDFLLFLLRWVSPWFYSSPHCL